MAQHETTRRTVSGSVGPAAIPDKLYFRIGEVAALCDLPTYVLRFWESEFSQLKPNKGGTGQRLYRHRDVEMALHIKRLLYDEGFTIPGARQVLKTEQRQKEPQLSLAIAGDRTPDTLDRKALQKLQKELREVLDLLSASPSQRILQPIRTVRSAQLEAPASQEPDDLFS